MANGKAKGSQWERDICKFLTHWLTGQNKEYFFWRSPGSGAVSTISMTNPDMHGDIIPVKPEAYLLTNIFSIEAKSGYKDASFDKHLKSNKNDPIENFWIQCVTDANKSNKYPMLIFKKKGSTTPWLGISDKIFDKLYKYLKDFRYISLYWDKKLPKCYFFEYKAFFERITPEIIKEEFSCD